MSLFKNALLENWNRVHSALTEQKRSDQLLRRLGYLAVQSIRNGTAMVRQCREQICDSIKMHTHYGPVGDFIHNVKTLQVRLQKRSSIGTPRSMPSRGDHGLSSPLRNKLKKIKDSYRIDNKLFDNPPTIIFISNFLPRFDKTSSDFRLFNILRILLANKCRIEYLYCAKTADDEKYAKALKGKIGLTYVPIGQQDYIKTIAEKNPDYVWITSLWRIDYVRFMAQLIKSLKQQHPSLKLIVDTMDFHYKEFLRKYEWTKNKDDLKLANEFLENEQNLYRTADTVVVISEEEKGDIQDKIMGISNCEVVPNIHDILDASRPYSGRRNICFVGQFGNKHNVDAVTYFLEEIFESILRKNPTVEFHVLGYSSQKYKRVFNSPHVKVIGSLKNLDKALTYYKLFVCPMTYGAGMKGKIGGAIAAGVPIVTTSIGAEGFPVRDGKECFIADSPMEFGEKCNQCLNDPITWHNLSVKSRLMIAENFSPHVVAGKLVKVLST
jgi:glycosyltransferase involved in cell wall biosynthesis